MPVYEMTAYPKALDVDGEGIEIVPLKPEHEKALLEFFLRVSEEDRYYLKEDVTSPDVITQWISGMDYSRAIPLVAITGDQIVADGTLHMRRAGARKHIGEVRLVVDSDHRNKGIGTALMRELITLANESGLEKVVFEAVADSQADAIEMMQARGFVRLATLPNHVRDVAGRPRDLVILELPLGRWQEWWDEER